MSFRKPILLTLLLAATGCATVTRGTREAWVIETQPAGATVSMSNGVRCTSPCTFKLKRKFSFDVQICKLGFEPVLTQVRSGPSNGGAMGMAGNVLVGGLIGVGVDAASGATQELRPNPLSVELVPAEPGCSEPEFPEVPEGGQTPEEYRKQNG